jgi:tetratricopeptide (TPR) repeat protein
MQKVSEAEKLEAIIRQLGVAELKMMRSGQIGLSVSLLFGASTSRILRSWYWHPVWLEVEGQDFRQMWTTSDRGDWLLWFCTHMIDQPGWPTHQQVVLAACQCARIALRHVNPREKRPLEAIVTAEAWAHGEATFEEVQTAGHAADCVYGQGDVVFLAAQSAHFAAWAVYAREDGHCFRRAQAAGGAASRAASATSLELMLAQHHAGDFTPAARAACDRVEKATLRQCADLVRQSLKVPDLLTTDFATPQRQTNKPTTVPTEKEQLWLDGFTAFERAKELYLRNEAQQALRYFDTAIDSGFDGSEIYVMRGGCLQSLGFDLDAIDDFTKAIELDPEDSNTYFQRSISKGAVGDLNGRVKDLNEAIRLSGIDSYSTRSHDAFARENGYKDGVAGFYRMQMVQANLDLERQAADERRLQGPAASLGPDLATKRRSKARRRARK